MGLVNIAVNFFYNCVNIPLQLAFTVDVQTTTTLSISVLSDLVFIADIFVSFRTAFFTRLAGNDVLITKGIEIAEKYVKGYLVIDILSIGVPFHTFMLQNFNEDGERGSQDIWSEVVQVFALLKMLRLLRFGRVIGRIIQTSLAVKHIGRILKLLGVFIFATHTSGCMFYAMGRWTSGSENACWIRYYQVATTNCPFHFKECFSLLICI